MLSFWVGGGHCHNHFGADNAQGGGLLPLDWVIFDTVSFELSGEVLVQSGVSLGVGGVSWVG